MFDGRLGEFEPPADFFPNKYFYTTEINKAVRDYFPKALTWEDIEKNES
jgi:energy-coupling factor transport system ATP-binding protein